MSHRATQTHLNPNQQQQGNGSSGNAQMGGGTPGGQQQAGTPPADEQPYTWGGNPPRH